MRHFPASIGIFLIATFALCAPGQVPESKPPRANETKGMPPRAAPGEYQAQAQAGKVTIAAEFAGHSVPRPEGTLSTDDYVVVETAFFGPQDARVTLSISDFTLRINGKKTPISSQPNELVDKSLTDPQWEPPEKPEPKSKSGINTGGNGGADSIPAPVHVPIELRRAMAQYVQKSSLPEGDRALPLAGLIFFSYRGKTQSIHSLELIYSGSAGNATLTLNP
jgi:hypothetical protein